MNPDILFKMLGINPLEIKKQAEYYMAEWDGVVQRQIRMEEKINELLRIKNAITDDSLPETITGKE